MIRACLRPALLIPLLLSATTAALAADVRVGQKLPRQGDEIVVCGQFFHTGTPVIFWMDPDGYDAYRVEPRFAGPETKKADKAHYGRRRVKLTPEQSQQVRGGGWDLPLLQSVVDQFVLHYDVAGTSRRCFEVLQDQRDLSVHFMLDLDGTLYQTLDLKEGAWHATKANGRSVGIEIANPGAYPDNETAALAKWYSKDSSGQVRIQIPDPLGASGIHNRSITLRPSREEPVKGQVQGQTLSQYDLTPQQYEALIKLTATLCTVFPKIKCDYPKDASGKLITSKLPDADYDRYEGILGHYHVQTNKVDPGPAFQWDTVINGARKLMAK